MEIDSDLTGEPKVQESDSSNRPAKDKLLSLLDKVEAHVEQLRKEALILEERKDSLFITLDTVRNSDLISELEETDKDDIFRYLDRVTSRCTTIGISVKTERDPLQEDALSQVNCLIDSLVINYKTDPGSSRTKCQTYMAACTSQPTCATDKSFELALLGCALDDQKKIRKRLEGLFDYLDRDGKILQMPED